MLTATPRVRNFEGTTSRHVACPALACDWDTTVDGGTPATAKKRAMKARLEHAETCPHVAALRAEQDARLAAFKAKQAGTSPAA